MIGREKNKSLIKYDLEKFIGERDLGEVKNFIKLKKLNKASSKNNTDAFLIQTIRGVWLIDTEKQNNENLIDLWGSGDLRYHSKMTGDLIEVSGKTFKISPGDGSSTKSALAVGKILYDYNFSIDSLCSLKFESRYVERSDFIWKAWLQAKLRPEEHLLALLETSTKAAFEESILGKASAFYNFILTTHRNLLVAISEVGDINLVELPKIKLEIEHSIGRSTVSCGEHKWATTVTNESLYKKIKEIAGLDPADSLRAIGLLIWQEKGLKKIDQIHKIFEIIQNIESATTLDTITGLVIRNLKNDRFESEDTPEHFNDLRGEFKEFVSSN